VVLRVAEAVGALVVALDKEEELVASRSGIPGLEWTEDGSWPLARRVSDRIVVSTIASERYGWRVL
jgi:hypothetical protein